VQSTYSLDDIENQIPLPASWGQLQPASSLQALLCANHPSPRSGMKLYAAPLVLLATVHVQPTEAERPSSALATSEVFVADRATEVGPAVGAPVVHQSHLAHDVLERR
jgi:hypothetical protein